MLDKFERVLEFNERKRLHCNNCKRVTIHTLEARCKGSSCDPRGRYRVGADFSIFRCGGCDTVCYETSNWDDNHIDYDEVDEAAYHIRFDYQYPQPVSSHFNFNTESTPAVLNEVLDEMLYAFAGVKLRLATIGLRLAIEFIVNDKKCKGHNLDKKINNLHEQGLVDDDQKDVLHSIRLKGNAGAHKARGMSPKELIAGMAIVEGLLEKLYNGPARHAQTIKNAKLLLNDPDTPAKPTII